MPLSTSPMPLDVRFMNAVSALLALVFAVMALTVAVSWASRQPFFNLQAIRVGGDLSHNNALTLRANIASKLAGNFMTVDLQAVRSTFEAIPWVRRAVVQREFPNRLKVVLHEHKAVAYWGAQGDARLVNNFGEVFEANAGDLENEELPLLSGPAGQAPRVLQAYQTLAPLFEEMDSVLEQLQLSPQGGWRAQLDTGAVIELGHGSLTEVQARTRRFVDTAVQVSSRFGRDVESADLRYTSGYALKLRGVTTIDLDETDKQKKKR